MADAPMSPEPVAAALGRLLREFDAAALDLFRRLNEVPLLPPDTRR